MAFVASGFEHSIVNWDLLPIGYLLDPSIQITGIFGNIFVVTIGNIVGGAFFVAFLYWYIYLHGSQK